MQLKDISFIPSPNCDDRPNGCDINLLVIHNISMPPNVFGGSAITELFTNQLDPHEHPEYAKVANLGVSAHALIRRDGELIQYVPFDKRAWHAGESSFQDQENCNDFSIGIELEGADEIPYEIVQYRCLAKLVRALMETYPGITQERIVGHCDISPARKTDPGSAFNWTYFFQLINNNKG